MGPSQANLGCLERLDNEARFMPAGNRPVFSARRRDFRCRLRSAQRLPTFLSPSAQTGGRIAVRLTVFTGNRIAAPSSVLGVTESLSLERSGVWRCSLDVEDAAKKR